MQKLNKKKVVITGGSTGIGFAISRHCLREGALPILLARKEHELENAIKCLQQEFNVECPYYCADVSSIESVAAVAKKVAQDHTKVDGLVNCAGVYGPIGKSHLIDPIKFTEAIQVNLLGSFYMCHFFIPLLSKDPRGKIVNFAGGGAASPFPNYSGYATSKVGVVRLTENLALELADSHIDVNSIAPGFVITDFHKETLVAGKSAGIDFLNKTKEEIRKGGVSPDVAATLAVFLLSSDSDQISGRFVSAPWDPWQDKDFQAQLRQDPDLATLRRIDSRLFYRKGNGL